jgi:hypothetical protein
MWWIVILIVVIVAAVFLLRGNNRITGEWRGPVSGGMRDYESERNMGRVACPHCAELIMPAAKVCPHCKLNVSPLIT